MTGTPEFQHLVYEVVDPVAVITLNRPERLNALSFALLAEIERAVGLAAQDRAAVGIVITGAGRGFSAGLDADDLTSVAGSGDIGEPPPADVRKGLFSYLTQVPKPVIAAVNGVAAGGGYVLATMCDLRFGGPDARFTTVFSKRGIIAEHGTSWITPRLVGVGNALDLLWTSRMVDAAEAHRLGLLEYLVDDETEGAVRAAAVDYVRTLAETVSPASMADTKRMVWQHAGQELDPALDDIWEAMKVGIARPDVAEGAASFVERRDPRFPRI